MTPLVSPQQTKVFQAAAIRCLALFEIFELKPFIALVSLRDVAGTEHDHVFDRRQIAGFRTVRDGPRRSAGTQPGTLLHKLRLRIPAERRIA